MGKRAVKRLVVYIAIFMLLAGCAGTVPGSNGNEKYAHIRLFCDVDFWVPPKWDTDPDTVTGKVTQETGVVLEVNVPPQDANNQLRLMLANGEIPDVISVTDQTTAKQLISSGKVWDLESFLKKYKPDSHLFQDFPEDVKRGLKKRDGNWYAYPSHLYNGDILDIWPPGPECYQDMATYGYNNGIIWNKKLLQAYGLTVDKLRDEAQVMQALEAAAGQKEAEGAEGLIPLLLDGQNYQGSSLVFLRDTYGVEPIDASGAYRDSFLQPEMKPALYFLYQCLQKGILQSEYLTISNTRIRELLAEGNVLCFIGNTANIDIDPGEWVSSGPILSMEGKHPVFGKEKEASLGWIQTFFSKECQHPKELATWLDYMTSPEGMTLWCFGKEGVHYREEGGLVEITAAGKEARRDSGNSGVNAWWMFANTAWERSVLAPFESGSMEEADLQIRVAYGKAEETRCFNQSLLEFPLDLESQELEAEIEAYKKEQVAKIILAEDDAGFEAEYLAMLAHLEELGIHKLDRRRDASYRQNCKEQGARLQKINK